MPQPVTELDELIAMMFQAHPWHGVPARNAKGELQAYIEIVPTDAVKYELDKASGHLRLDRPQRYSSFCPTLYGFIPRTYCGRRVGACIGHDRCVGHHRGVIATACSERCQDERSHGISAAV